MPTGCQYCDIRTGEVSLGVDDVRPRIRHKVRPGRQTLDFKESVHSFDRRVFADMTDCEIDRDNAGGLRVCNRKK